MIDVLSALLRELAEIAVVINTANPSMPTVRMKPATNTSIMLSPASAVS